MWLNPPNATVTNGKRTVELCDSSVCRILAGKGDGCLALGRTSLPVCVDLDLEATAALAIISLKINIINLLHSKVTTYSFAQSMEEHKK